jgi:hypothetical protein
MIATSRKPRLLQRWGKWCALILRCSLILAAWQGPIPWCHCHGTLAGEPATNQQWLAGHLHSQHVSTSPFANVDFGWHLHAQLPDAPDEHGKVPANPAKHRLPTLGSGSEFDGSCGGSILHGADQFAAFGAATNTAPTHSFDSFAPSVALLVRLRVMRN